MGFRDCMSSTNPILDPSPFTGSYHCLRVLRRVLETYLARAGKPGVLCVDFGCGQGPYRPLVEGVGMRYVGADISVVPNTDVELGADGRVAMADGAAGCVLSTQVLEHVPDPKGYLDEACRLLGPGGMLILSTHGHWNFHPTPTDYWRWTNPGLRKVVEESGFTVVDFEGVMGPLPTALQMVSNALQARIPRLVLPLFHWVWQNLVRLTDAMHRAPARDADACVFVLRAVKKG
jgi:SAM-dependent methyltransferase